MGRCGGEPDGPCTFVSNSISHSWTSVTIDADNLVRIEVTMPSAVPPATTPSGRGIMRTSPRGRLSSLTSSPRSRRSRRPPRVNTARRSSILVRRSWRCLSGPTILFVSRPLSAARRFLTTFPLPHQGITIDQFQEKGINKSTTVLPRDGESVVDEARCVTSQLTRLYEAGFRSFVVLNTIPLQYTPYWSYDDIQVYCESL